MRLLLVSALLVATAAGRRAPPPVEPPKTPSALVSPYWGYPYGWGLDDSYFGLPEEFNIHKVEDIETVKQVKAAEPPKPTTASPEHYPLPGWFGVTPDMQSRARGWVRTAAHRDLKDIEAAMDGFE